MSGRVKSRLSRLRSDERGFTVVEGAVAALILVIGALAALQAFDSGTRNTFRAEQGHPRRVTGSSPAPISPW
jgi:Tfp pilus assembly protein PilV